MHSSARKDAKNAYTFQFQSGTASDASKTQHPIPGQKMHKARAHRTWDGDQSRVEWARMVHAQQRSVGSSKMRRAWQRATALRTKAMSSTGAGRDVGRGGQRPTPPCAVTARRVTSVPWGGLPHLEFGCRLVDKRPGSHSPSALQRRRCLLFPRPFRSLLLLVESSR